MEQPSKKAEGIKRRIARRKRDRKKLEKMYAREAAKVLHDNRCAKVLHGPEKDCNCPMAAFHRHKEA